MIINAGIERIVCLSTYPDDLALEMLEAAGVQLEILSEPEKKEEGK